MKKFLLSLSLGLFSFATFCQPTERIQDFSDSPGMISDINLPYDGNARKLFSKFLPIRDVDEFRLVSSETDGIGFVHERYAQYFRQVRVEGGEYLIHRRNGVVNSLSGDFRRIPEMDVVPVLAAERALEAAVKHVGAKVYSWEPVVNAGYPGYKKPKGQLVIWDGVQAGKKGPRLAWKLDIYAHEPLYRAYVFVDARNGDVLAEHHLIHETNAPSSGTTLYNGTQTFTADLTSGAFRLRASSASGGVETYSLNNGTNYGAATDITSPTSVFASDPVANQAHWGTEKTLVYYKTMHNRSSFDNQGATIKSYVHYSTKYVNAFWDGSRMTYGDGDGTTYKALVSLDILGHEITHGVTQYSANLIYQNESGALNESFSDIFGEAIESFAKGSNDWLMGCDIGVNGCGAFRSMKNPNLYGDPDTYGGVNWYTGTGDNGGVHINSGVQNKWFYILAMGESAVNDLGNSYTVAGIGLQKASAIAYRNLAYYLTSGSNFVNARAGSIQAAIDLFGSGSPEVIATTNAWHAVGVGCPHGQICYCSSKGNSQADEWIANVTIGSFSNISAGSPYTFFSTKNILLTPGVAHTLSLTPGYTGTAYNESWRIWLDLNKDADFEDAGELVFDGGVATAGTRTGTFTVPVSATGQTRMRVSMKYNALPTPCEAFQYGEVEDYPVTFGTAPAPDTQAPTAPVLSSPAKTTNSISLSWTASTDNVGVAGYDVYVNNVKNNPTNITGTTYTASGLAANTAYTLQVRARDAAGNIASSNTLTVTTLGDTQAPSAPLLSSPAKTTNSISLSWTASTDNVGVAGYDVYVNNVKNNPTNITGRTYTASGLTANTAYTLQVRARDAAGNTASSNTLTMTTLGDTQAPSAPLLSSPGKTTNSISLSWTASTDNVGVAGYDVYVNNVKNNPTNITGRTYTASGLAANTAYTLQVRARDAAGNTASSNTLTVTTLGDTQAPSAPLLSSPGKTTNSISLSWTASTDNVGVAGYDVYVNNVKNNPTNITGRTYTASGLAANTAYTLQVRARDAAGNTASSNTLTVTTLGDTQAPSAPLLSSPGKTTNSISLSWTASTDNVGVAGYDVYVNNVKNNPTNITGRTYNVINLAAGTTFSIFVRARDFAGNFAQSNTLSISTATVVETTFASYFFPTSLEGWTTSSSINGQWSNNSSSAWEGVGSMLLRSSASSAVSPILRMRGQSQAELKLYFTPRSFELGKSFNIQYSRNLGNSFTTAVTVTSGTSVGPTRFINNASFYLLSITLNGILWNDSTRFRIQMNGADTTDKIHFDAITIKGRTNTNAIGNIVTLAAVTKSFNINGFADELPEDRSLSGIQIYPNPVKSRLHVAGIKGIQHVRIFSISGSIVGYFDNVSDLDVSGLTKGVYILEIESIEGVTRRRFLKE